MDSVWKKIEVKGYDNYSVSNTGLVRNDDTGKLLKPQKTRGYYYVHLKRCGKLKNKYIHRLVAQAFIPNPENKPQINHIDGNPQNNCVSNLEWCTQSENILHRYRVLGKKPNMEAAINMCKKKVVCVETGEIFESAAVAGRVFEISPSCITRAIHKEYYTAKGYHWRFAI